MNPIQSYNAYVHTKYLAEEKVLKAMANQGLDAKIMRLGLHWSITDLNYLKHMIETLFFIT